MSHSESPLTRPRTDLLILDARLPDGTAVDIAVDGSMISEVAPAGTAPGRPASHTIDASGALALPALAEPHAHLDKALTAGRIANPTNDLAGAIVAWIEARPSMTIGDTADRALRAAHELVANGAGVIRTHVDTGRGIGADGVEALESVRRRLDALVELQLVVCASFPLTGAAGADNLAIAATRSRPDAPSPSAVRRTSTNARARRSICSPISPPMPGSDSTCMSTRPSTQRCSPCPTSSPSPSGASPARSSPATA